MALLSFQKDCSPLTLPFSCPAVLQCGRLRFYMRIQNDKMGDLSDRSMNFQLTYLFLKRIEWREGGVVWAADQPATISTILFSVSQFPQSSNEDSVFFLHNYKYGYYCGLVTQLFNLKTYLCKNT